MSSGVLFIIATISGILIGYLAFKNHWKIAEIF